jgi:hypothetical protein
VPAPVLEDHDTHEHEVKIFKKDDMEQRTSTRAGRHWYMDYPEQSRGGVMTTRKATTRSQPRKVKDENMSTPMIRGYERTVSFIGVIIESDRQLTA